MSNSTTDREFEYGNGQERVTRPHETDHQRLRCLHILCNLPAKVTTPGFAYTDSSCTRQMDWGRIKLAEEASCTYDVGGCSNDRQCKTCMVAFSYVNRSDDARLC